MDRPPPSILLRKKTRLNYLSHGIKIWTDFSSVLSQCTRLTDRLTDRRTDRNLIRRLRLHSMQRGKNEHVDHWDIGQSDYTTVVGYISMTAGKR